MCTEDRYFLVLAPNWVVTRVPLRFWTNGTVTGKKNKKNKNNFFFMIFFTSFWHGWFLSVYPTVMTFNLTTNSVTWRCRNETECCCFSTAVFSISRAANFTRFVTAVKHTALLWLHTMRALQVFGDVAYPKFPLDTVRCVTDPVLLRCLQSARTGTVRLTAGIRRPKSSRDNHMITHDQSYRYVS